MVFGDVEQLEVVFFGLHIAAAVDLEAHVAPDAVDLAQRLRGRMEPPAPLAAPGQRYINRLRLHLGV
jgi:hypothetical protein